MPAIELEGLTRRYGERAALDDVTAELDAGETLVVFGPNGAGKSTLLRVLATLLRPQRGRRARPRARRAAGAAGACAATSASSATTRCSTAT